jgi:hypothetical protein
VLSAFLFAIPAFAAAHAATRCDSQHLNYLSTMPTEISIPDAEDLKSRVRELRRFL